MPDTPTLLLVPAPERGIPAITRHTNNKDIINQLAALVISKVEQHLRSNTAPNGIKVHLALRESEKRLLQSACPVGEQLRTVFNEKISKASAVGRIHNAKLKYTYAVYESHQQGYSFTFRPMT